MVIFSAPVEEVYERFLDGEYLSKALRSTCSNSGDIGGSYSLYNDAITGTNLLLLPPMRILQTFQHRDWPAHKVPAQLQSF